MVDPDQTTVRFEFEDPIVEMLRVACLLDTCKDTSNMAFSYEPNGGMLEDICNGERYRRIADDLGRGSAILGSILATDGICLDKCMFDSQDVGALSCTFVRGAKRERDECMISCAHLAKYSWQATTTTAWPLRNSKSFWTTFR